MNIVKVKFKSDIIEVIDNYVSVKNLCGNMGLKYETQYRKIKADKSYCSKIVKVQTAGGMQEAFCIPFNKINGWLFSINPNRVKQEVKQKLIEYKNECFDVLHKHFTQQSPSQENFRLLVEDYAKLETECFNLRKTVMYQNKLIASQPQIHKKSRLAPVDHNNMLEMVYQFAKMNKETTELINTLAQRNLSIHNFLNQFKTRYPEASDYVDKCMSN